MDNIKDTLRSMFKALVCPDNKLSLIPNWLSFSRAIGGFLIPILVYSGASLLVIGGTCFFIGMTDFLDGKLARYLVKEETRDGAMLDAISDKIFSFLLMISIIPTVPIFALNIILEVAISVINGKLLSQGKTPKSNLLGKIKTWPLFIALGLSYMGLTISSPILFGVASGFSLVTACLEGVNIKQYLDTYNTKELTDKAYEEVYDEEEELLEEKEKTNSYKLCKNAEIPVIVFNNLEKQNDYQDVETNGKQKTMKL